MCWQLIFFFFFFFNDTATTEIYTLSLHDALPISSAGRARRRIAGQRRRGRRIARRRAMKPVACCSGGSAAWPRSEEHTSELQSRQYLVCRLLLEKKKKTKLNDLTLIIKTLYNYRT